MLSLVLPRPGALFGVGGEALERGPAPAARACARWRSPGGEAPGAGAGDAGDTGGEEGGAGAARAEHVERGGEDPGELRPLRAHPQGRVPGRDLSPDASLRLLRRLLHQSPDSI
uniref:Uncharacterized protein n=1 Tax=Ananas comosus var. bracteatus TaxID=296719 RepID=A0A6V7QXT7_ANACO